jgi:hypothetical protein
MPSKLTQWWRLVDVQAAIASGALHQRSGTALQSIEATRRDAQSEVPDAQSQVMKAGTSCLLGRKRRVASAAQALEPRSATAMGAESKACGGVPRAAATECVREGQSGRT